MRAHKFKKTAKSQQCDLSTGTANGQAFGGRAVRGSPLISQGDWPLVGVYPHMSPHRRIGFTARRPAGNMMMPDRCQTPEVPILQTSKCPPCLNACDRVICRQA